MPYAFTHRLFCPKNNPVHMVSPYVLQQLVGYWNIIAIARKIASVEKDG
jgi:hypothetical protein